MILHPPGGSESPGRCDLRGVHLATFNAMFIFDVHLDTEWLLRYDAAHFA
ncbi:MAG TPA: hypothetical protein VLE20_01700 [Blastocatellia bacterium]|nr:hypothetical protein [Blastocatellia bacterium]